MTQNHTPIHVNELAIEMRSGFKEIHTTIDDLAGMVARGFKEVDTNLALVRKDIAEVKEDVAHIEYRIDTLEKSILKDHDTRIRRVERKLQLA